MTQIINEHGTFEAPTEREALKLARNAARKAKRDEARLSAARDKATERACATGYRIHEAFADIKTGIRESFPRGWFVWRPGDDFGPKLEPALCCHGHKARYETAHGFVSGDHYAQYVRGALYNGAGFIIAVAFEHADKPGDCAVCAIGACDEQAAFVPLTGVTLASLIEAQAKGQR